MTETDPTLLEDLRRLLEPATMGDPMRPLLWVSKSHAKLAEALSAMGHKIKKSSVPKLLELLKYRRQVNRKTLEGSNNPDRDAQFEHINAAVISTQTAGQPVISIDTKKKELIGPYKNGGSDYRPEGCPDKVNEHDFADKELGKAIPYGVYDIAANAGCVSVGIDNDTAQRGKPLISRQTVVELIASTTTKAGLMVRCELDTGIYPKGIQVSKEEMATLYITGDAFHPEWNYTVSPRVPP